MQWQLFLRVINNIIWRISYDASMPLEVIRGNHVWRNCGCWCGCRAKLSIMRISDILTHEPASSWQSTWLCNFEWGEGLDCEWFKWDSCQEQSWLECVISWLFSLQHLQRRETLFSNRCTVPTEHLSSHVWFCKYVAIQVIIICRAEGVLQCGVTYYI